ncbi:hypothetical protein ESCO_003568 [Escovopsis weberi]|uniref:Uncharacterized protein n=1 Tax=Escovopsis weberi TaxID=150374 RepID=A0A0M9VXC0_ESCWE|nr:hypothetical protein ESCO_003568 [Escovopsis weberi]
MHLRTDLGHTIPERHHLPHGPQAIPERLPTEREVGEMLSNVEYLKNSLEHIREIVLVSIQSERLREDIKRGYEEDPDVHMYSDSVKPHYMAEVKKRRGSIIKRARH